MRTRPRHSDTGIRLQPPQRRSLSGAGSRSAGEIDGAQPLQLDILINGNKTDLLGSFLKLANGRPQPAVPS